MMNIRKNAFSLILISLLFNNSAFAEQSTPLQQPEVVANITGATPTGITVAPNGRIFVNFPKWSNDVKFSVGELIDGKVVPYPDSDINNPTSDKPVNERFISVQSVVADGKNRLWVLDTAAPFFQSPIKGGAKLVAIDLNNDKVTQTILLSEKVILPSTYINDVRFDLSKGEQGVAYITDSSMTGPGGFIVVDLKTGNATRRLSGHYSTQPDKNFKPFIAGKAFMMRPEQGKESPFMVGSDGIAISANGETLYYTPLSSRHLYSISTKTLLNNDLNEQQLAKLVIDHGEKRGASDGLAEDNKNNIYASDYENSAILKRDPQGRWSTLAQSPDIQWPDTLAVSNDGYLYFTTNQLHLQPGFNYGKDLRQQPYKVMRIKINAQPVYLK